MTWRPALTRRRRLQYWELVLIAASLYGVLWLAGLYAAALLAGVAP